MARDDVARRASSPKKTKKKHPTNSHQKYHRVTKGVGSARSARQKLPSHDQLKSLLLMIEPSSIRRDKFNNIVAHFENKTVDAHFPKYLPSCPPQDIFSDFKKFADKKVCKTPQWLVAYALSAIGYTFQETTREWMSTHPVGAFLLVGILNNKSKVQHVADHNFHQPNIEYVKSYHASGSATMDETKTIAIFIPSCNYFYCLFGSNQYFKEGFAPLPASFLRIKRHDGNVAKGGFFKEINQVFYIHPKIENIHKVVTTPALENTIIFHGHHVPDCNICLPPDHWTSLSGQDHFSKNKDWPMNIDDRRKRWFQLLTESSTNRSLCKQTVRCCIYKTLPDPLSGRSFFLDISTLQPNEQVVLRVVVQNYSDTNQNKFDMKDQSTIIIRRIDFGQFPHLEQLAQQMQRVYSANPTLHNVRNADGQVGSMIALGEHALPVARVAGLTKDIKLYARTNEFAQKHIPMHRDRFGPYAGQFLLPSFMREYRNVLNQVMPMEMATMESHMHYFGEEPPLQMGGTLGVVKSMNVSLDLGNPPHFDSNDLGHSMSLWTEDRPGTASNWNFVCPNLLLKDPRHIDNQAHGAYFKLCHGAMIEWDGVLVRHASGMPTPGHGNHVYGFQCCNNFPSLKEYEKIRSERREMKKSSTRDNHY